MVSVAGLVAAFVRFTGSRVRDYFWMLHRDVPFPTQTQSPWLQHVYDSPQGFDYYVFYFPPVMPATGEFPRLARVAESLLTSGNGRLVQRMTLLDRSTLELIAVTGAK